MCIQSSELCHGLMSLLETKMNSLYAFLHYAFFTILTFFFKKYMQKFRKNKLFMHILTHTKNIQSMSTVKQDNERGKEI